MSNICCSTTEDGQSVRSRKKIRYVDFTNDLKKFVKRVENAKHLAQDHFMKGSDLNASINVSSNIRARAIKRRNKLARLSVKNKPKQNIGS